MSLSGDVTASPRSTRDQRYARYGRVDLHGIRAHRVTSAADFAAVSSLRAAGFTRVIGNGATPGLWVDDLDEAPGVFSLIGYDREGRALATMRVHDGRQAGLELSRFVPLRSLLRHQDLPAAQFARLSVIKAPEATEVMFGLFKAAWHWCYRQGLQSIAIATPPWSKPIYDFMLFEDLGSDGRFTHALAGGSQHVVMRLPVLDAEAIWRAAGHPLCGVFFDTEHPALSI